ncbi:ASCH domain-containing protein [Dyadobacter psychrotolerans]|nr:ASCH domain-containing protein [Dyadobacter psychrotolerans]
MLFKQKHLEGIKSGKISLAFRKWKKLTVSEGNLIKTSVGNIKIVSVEEIALQNISDEEAEKAGFKNASSLVQLLEEQKEGAIYRIGVVFDSEDPRIELRERFQFEEGELEGLKSELEILDKYSKIGKWTTKTLQVIRENPKMKAADLAVKAKKEKEWLKLNVRKLKSLGLTISHEPGYTLSPRGEAYMDSIEK